MQPLTAAPRDALTAAQVSAILTAPALTVDYGCELLDADLALVSDISADCGGGTVHRDCNAAVHGTVDLTLSRTLAWGKDRVRPYMTLTAGGISARFNLGVYLLTTPSTPLQENPVTYAVTGYDQIHLLQDNIGDSYSVAAGANVLGAATAALTAAGITAPVLLDSTASAAVLGTPLVFPLTSSSNPTWLQIVNGLLLTINYQGIWCDWDGAFRSGPYIVPSARPSEWTFKVGDLSVGIVAANRTVTSDVWNVPNWWRYVRNGLVTPPTEGVGQYTVQNVSTGLSSQTSVGRTVHAPVVYLDAVDQTSLQAQGDALVAAAMRSSEVITTTLSSWPVAFHWDVVTYSDAALGDDRQAQCSSWSLPLNGADMAYTLESV